MRRASRKYILDLFKKNPNWSILDLGGGSDAFTSATTVFDIEDYSSLYTTKRFVQGEACSTPFDDKEFDFVTACHIIEHVKDPKAFCGELMRIGKRGYIEFPTPFFDNVVYGNSNPPPHGHVWWVTFDDDEQKMIFKPKVTVMPESVRPRDTTFLIPFFANSMVTGLLWEQDILFEVQKAVFTYSAGNSDPERVVDLSINPKEALARWGASIYGTPAPIKEKTTKNNIDWNFDDSK